MLKGHDPPPSAVWAPLGLVPSRVDRDSMRGVLFADRLEIGRDATRTTAIAAMTMKTRMRFVENIPVGSVNRGVSSLIDVELIQAQYPDGRSPSRRAPRHSATAWVAGSGVWLWPSFFCITRDERSNLGELDRRCLMAWIRRKEGVFTCHERDGTCRRQHFDAQRSPRRPGVLTSLEESKPEQEITRFLDLGFRESIQAFRLEVSPNQIGRVLDRSAPDLRRAAARKEASAASSRRF